MEHIAAYVECVMNGSGCAWCGGTVGWGIVAGVWGDVPGIAGVVAVLLLDTEWLSSCPCALSTYKGSVQLYIGLTIHKLTMYFSSFLLRCGKLHLCFFLHPFVMLKNLHNLVLVDFSIGKGQHHKWTPFTVTAHTPRRSWDYQTRLRKWPLLWCLQMYHSAPSQSDKITGCRWIRWWIQYWWCKEKDEEY